MYSVRITPMLPRMQYPSIFTMFRCFTLLRIFISMGNLHRDRSTVLTAHCLPGANSVR
uniref:Uncharacterized protein n=1 Tax=Arundo donax TaxID=35708 RepID=A0A0A8ZFQ1_ARUDO